VNQIGERADDQLGRDALPEISSTPDLKGDLQLLQRRLERQTNGAGTVQYGHVPGDGAVADQLGDGERHLPRLDLW